MLSSSSTIVDRKLLNIMEETLIDVGRLVEEFAEVFHRSLISGEEVRMVPFFDRTG